jgi:dipeptidyl aminopeptidase/acylaminoacyl peptidase
MSIANPPFASRSCLLVALLLAHAAGPVTAQPTTRLPFTPERSWQLARIGAPTISPDGRTAIAAVTRYDLPSNRSDSDLWIWSTDGRSERQLTSIGENDANPVISPDGRQVAFVARRAGDTAPQLYLLPLGGGEARRLTNVATGVSQPKWFRDGRSLAFLTRVWPDLATFDAQARRLEERRSGKSTMQVWENAPVTSWDQFVDDRELHVFAVPVEGGEPRPVTPGTGLELPRRAMPLFEQPVYDIAPDGREIAFVADSDPRPAYVNHDVFTLRIGEKQARNWTKANEANDLSPLYSPDGRHLAFTQQRTRNFYGDLQRLTLVDRQRGQVRDLAPGWDRSADGLVWGGDSKRLYGAIDDAGTTRVHEFTLDGKVRPLTGATSYATLACALGTGTLVGTRSSFVEPPTLVRIDPRTGQARQLSRINDTLLAGTALGTYESVIYEGADGADIQMWVNYPPGFDRDRKYPLFLLIHGGPHNGVTDAMQFRWNAQVFSSWGYVTAWPNFHGSSGFGLAFTDSINPQQDDLPYRDVIAAARWFEQQPWIDRERMVAGGGSFGGYLASIILGREHPFKALIAHAGVYNWYSQYGADYMSEMPRFGGFWTDAQRQVYERGSPHYGAANFDTPTLVIHGEIDYRVPVNQGIELYQTLVLKGVPTRLVHFPDENHWILKPANSVAWYEEVRKWLAKYAPPAGVEGAN